MIMMIIVVPSIYFDEFFLQIVGMAVKKNAKTKRVIIIIVTIGRRRNLRENISNECEQA